MYCARLFLMAVISLVLGASVTGCWEPPKLIETKIKQYVLISVKKPKNFYISLRDVETGVVYRDLRVSTSCSKWQRLRVYKVYKFEERTYQRHDGSIYKAPYTKDFCKYLSSLY